MADVKPRIKLDKKQAKKGDLVEVKALVSHIMETGQRKDASGNTIPRKILNKFTCTVNGKEVFSADFEPAVSANPYIQFKFRAQESGPVVLTWIDDDGKKIVGEDFDHGVLTATRRAGVIRPADRGADADFRRRMRGRRWHGAESSEWSRGAISFRLSPRPRPFCRTAGPELSPSNV